jgi:hypothetical protein
LGSPRNIAFCQKYHPLIVKVFKKKPGIYHAPDVNQALGADPNRMAHIPSACALIDVTLLKKIGTSDFNTFIGGTNPIDYTSLHFP